MNKKHWPILKKYDCEHLRKIAMPIGGIGTGSISLGGRGNLQDWEINSHPAKGFTPMVAEDVIGNSPFFAIRCKDEKGDIFAKLLEGQIDINDYEGYRGCNIPNHGFPRFENAQFHAAYPFGQVILEDNNFPIKAKLKAFNPLIPGDVENSSLPFAYIAVEVENVSSAKIETSVSGSIANYLYDKEHFECIKSQPPSSLNSYVKNNKMHTISLNSSPKLNKDDNRVGSIALSSKSCAGQRVSYTTSWSTAKWATQSLRFWNDFYANGEISSMRGEVPMASLCLKRTIPAGETSVFEFLISWHMPNRKSWTGLGDKKNILTNYYSTKFINATNVAEKVFPILQELENKTIDFVEAFCSASIPNVIKEAALFNLSTLNTETCFMVDDNFFGWEGCSDTYGLCYGNCTHVWNYEVSTAFLFGDIAKNMRQTEFKYNVKKNGLMRFRVDIPFDAHVSPDWAAADGQMGCIMKLYRDWQLSGDDMMLNKLYPNAKKAMQFCWLEGGWDADKDGIMEGCQHNTMDVEYFGPNPQMSFWYLGALKSMELIADYLGDNDFAVECADLYDNGSRLINEKCFNGEYYEQLIVPCQENYPLEGLMADMGTKDLTNPEFQLGGACLVDQLAGQYMAHIIGIPPLSIPLNIKKTLKSIYKYNFKRGFKDHFCNMRSFVLGDECGLLMASYPHGNIPKTPFPYAKEVMTGFEYTAAVGMLYEGMLDEGVEVISAIRERYDGRKRNPFNEAECGHHYARTMAAFAAVNALSGFNYSASKKTMCFVDRLGLYFWSTGYAWGTVEITKDDVRLNVLYGKINTDKLIIGNRNIIKI